MSILIKGIEMPTYEQGDIVLRVRWDGRVDKDFSGNTVATAVPVPPHGDLIDRDALPWEKQSLMVADEGWALPCDLIIDAPTIIEAEEG